jgi:hypothetical protein
MGPYSTPVFFKSIVLAECQCLTPVILDQEESVVQSQPGQIVHVTQSQKYPSQQRAGGVAHGVNPVFKSQYGKKKNYCPGCLG